MQSIERYTLPQVILLAASELTEPFTEADLAVGTWSKDPNRFGLPNHPHPDNNKLRVNMMGAKGIIKRGYVIKVGVLLYRLSEIGREYVERLKLENIPMEPILRAKVVSVKLTPREIQLVKEGRQRTAYRRYIMGQVTDIDVPLTRLFYTGTSPIEFHALTKKLNQMIEASIPVRLGDGEEIGSKAITLLTDCHTYLLKTHGGRLN